MNFNINENVIERFPCLRVGVIVARASGSFKTDVASEALRAAIEEARKQFPDAAAAEADALLSVWPDVYRSIGLNPKRTKPTVNALYDRILRGRDLTIPLPLVAVSVAVCISTRLPVGGYDLDRVVGDIDLRISNGGENFLGVGETSPDTTRPGEIVYSDGVGVLTRAWNHRDSDRTKLTAETQSIVLMIEAPTARVADEDLSNGVETLAQLLCSVGATIEEVVMRDAKRATVALR